MPAAPLTSDVAPDPSPEAGSRRPDTARPRASQSLVWLDPITGDRLDVRLSAGAGLLDRLLRGGFEEASPAPGGAFGPGPGVAA